MNTFLIRVLPIVLLTSLLSGCAGVNGRFGCNKTANVSCTSISEVNAKANAGLFNHRLNGSTRRYSKMIAIHHQGTVVITGQPVRSNDRVQRIWIAPYYDLDNNYHEASYVDTIVEKSHWIGRPAKEINTQPTK